MAITLFLLWCTVLVPSLKNTALVFLEIFMIEFCTVLEEPPTLYVVITFLICIVQKRKYLWNKKRYSKNKTTFLNLESLSNEQQLYCTFGYPKALQKLVFIFYLNFARLWSLEFVKLSNKGPNPFIVSDNNW